MAEEARLPGTLGGQRTDLVAGPSALLLGGKVAVAMAAAVELWIPPHTHRGVASVFMGKEEDMEEGEEEPPGMNPTVNPHLSHKALLYALH